jgi:hypothetical protein
MDFISGAIHGGAFLIWLVETEKFHTASLIFYTAQMKRSTNSYEKVEWLKITEI